MRKLREKEKTSDCTRGSSGSIRTCSIRAEGRYGAKAPLLPKLKELESLAAGAVINQTQNATKRRLKVSRSSRKHINEGAPMEAKRAQAPEGISQMSAATKISMPQIYIVSNPGVA